MKDIIHTGFPYPCCVFCVYFSQYDCLYKCPKVVPLSICCPIAGSLQCVLFGFFEC